jgi:hypothetical protein
VKNTAKKSNKSDAAKQKKQLVMLGCLSVVLVGAMIMQFGAGEPEFEVAALAELASNALTGPDESDEAKPAAAVSDNDILSAPSEFEEFGGNPFSNFWNVASESSKGMAEVVPPSVTLNATLASERHGLAIIDGQLRSVGDSIDGWMLHEVRARAIVLRSPKADEIVVEMPLLQASVVLPNLPAAHKGAHASTDESVDGGSPGDG